MPTSGHRGFQEEEVGAEAGSPVNYGIRIPVQAGEGAWAHHQETQELAGEGVAPHWHRETLALAVEGVQLPLRMQEVEGEVVEEEEAGAAHLQQH